MEIQSYIPWEQVTHIILDKNYMIVYYCDKSSEHHKIQLTDFNSLLIYNENFIRVNYNIIINRKFISSTYKIRKKVVLLVNKFEITVSRRKAYHFK